MINLSNLFNPLPFELELREIIIIKKMKNKIINTNWCQDGKMQEKGQQTEQLVKDLLFLFDDIKIRRSEKNSVLDEVFKIDFVIESISDPLDVFAFQVKSSVKGAMEHHLKYGEQIVWEESCIRTPWCLIIDGSLSNYEMFNMLAEQLELDNSLDFDKLEKIRDKVNLDNNKLRSLKEIKECFGPISKKEDKALRLFYNIGKKGKVYYKK